MVMMGYQLLSLRSSTIQGTLSTLFGLSLDVGFDIFFSFFFLRSALGIDMWNLLPFSRGTVKIHVGATSLYNQTHVAHIGISTQSTNPFTYPTIRVGYFGADIDLDVQVATARLARRILTSPPLRSVLKK
jgi:hypothetical protein